MADTLTREERYAKAAKKIREWCEEHPEEPYLFHMTPEHEPIAIGGMLPREEQEVAEAVGLKLFDALARIGALEAEKAQWAQAIADKCGDHIAAVAAEQRAYGIADGFKADRADLIAMLEEYVDDRMDSPRFSQRYMDRIVRTVALLSRFDEEGT